MKLCWHKYNSTYVKTNRLTLGWGLKPVPVWEEIKTCRCGKIKKEEWLMFGDKSVEDLTDYNGRWEKGKYILEKNNAC